MPTVNVSDFTKLPAPGQSPPTLTSGTVTFYRDNNWGSDQRSITLAGSVEGNRITLNSAIFDEATYVAFNLPVGVVVTLMDNVVPRSSGRSIGDLSDCGRCVDLIGTGTTEALDLVAYGMNDCISAYFWRKVNLDLGAIELFEHVDFTGNRAVLFLSEWEPGQIHSIGNWWLQDRVSSLRWKTLVDRQTAEMFDNSDGTGNSFSNIASYITTKECSSLADVGFNDCISAFRWDGLVPKKEKIAPFEVTATPSGNASGLTAVVEGINATNLAQPAVLKISNADAQTVTISTTDTYASGIKGTYSYKLGVDVGTTTVEQTFTVEVSFTYTRSQTETKSETKTVMLEVSQTVNAPPNTRYKGTMLIQLGTVSSQVYETTAERWYDQNVSGSTLDPANNNWYKRTEPVTVTLSGTLACSTSVNMETSPL